MNLLQDKNIVVIGGTTGLGLSAANAFVAEGANVVIVGRNEESVEEAKKMLGKNAFAFSADATQPETAIEAINKCIEKFGGFDGLYHVAGGSGRKMGDGPLHELTLDGWNKTLELNLTSLMLSNQAAIKKFIELSKGPPWEKRRNNIKHEFSTGIFAITKIFFNACICGC